MKERIKAIRKQAKLSQTEFAGRLGLTQNYVSLIESGQRTPADRTIGDICREFGISKDWLLTGDGEMRVPEASDALSEACRRYGAGDAVTKVLQAVLEVKPDIRDPFMEYVLERLAQPAYKVRTVAFFNRLASAGDGQYVFDGIGQDTIDIPNTEENRRVIYAIEVNGDSMEPMYSDGDVLLVTKDEVEIGEVGIFIKGGEAYVKKRGEESLISINPAYDDIPLDAETRCFGKVKGKR